MVVNATASDQEPGKRRDAAEQVERVGSVVIIGGGVVGIACAHYLSKAGFATTVVDKGPIGSACSRANCGYVCPSHVMPLTVPEAIPMALRSLVTPESAFRVKPQLSPAFWKWMIQFGLRCRTSSAITAGQALKSILDSSLTEYRLIIPAERLQCQWKETGLLNVFESKQAFDGYGKTHEQVEKHFDVSIQRVSGDDLADFDSALKPGLAGAYWYPGDASLRPDLLNNQWRGRLTDAGVVFREHCSVIGIDRGPSGKIQQLQTSSGPIKADTYVFSVGAWSGAFGKMLGCSLPVQPGKGYSVTFARPEVCPSYPMLFPEKKVGISPFEDGLRLGSMMEFVGFDESISSSRIEQLKNAAAPFLKSVIPGDQADESDRWFGWRPMTWDTLPVIGPAPNCENAIIATGHNMLGVSMAPATGRLVRELIAGEQPHLDIKPFSPARF